MTVLLRKKGFLAICFLLWLLSPAASLAHDIGKSLTQLELLPEAVSGESSICVDDLKAVIPLSNIKDDAVLSSEINLNKQEILVYFKSHFSVKVNDQTLLYTPQAVTLGENLNCKFVKISFKAPLSATGKLPVIKIEHRLFAREVPGYFGVLKVTAGNQTKTALVQSIPGQSVVYFDKKKEIVDFVLFGMNHIWGGLDHIFFILLLVLGAYATENKLGDKGAFYELVKLATAFTIAHSLTLYIAVKQYYMFPSKFVESMIALSIVFLGIENLYYSSQRRSWIVVFMFGLFHGMGFAGVLKELGLARGELVAPLLSFNVGIEIGQVAIILIAVMGLYLLSRLRFEMHKAIRFSSFIITAIAFFWLWQRITM